MEARWSEYGSTSPTTSTFGDVGMRNARPSARPVMRAGQGAAGRGHTSGSAASKTGFAKSGPLRRKTVVSAYQAKPEVLKAAEAAEARRAVAVPSTSSFFDGSLAKPPRSGSSLPAQGLARPDSYSSTSSARPPFAPQLPASSKGKLRIINLDELDPSLSSSSTSRPSKAPSHQPSRTPSPADLEILTPKRSAAARRKAAIKQASGPFGVSGMDSSGDEGEESDTLRFVGTRNSSPESEHPKSTPIAQKVKKRLNGEYEPPKPTAAEKKKAAADKRKAAAEGKLDVKGKGKAVAASRGGELLLVKDRTSDEKGEDDNSDVGWGGIAVRTADAVVSLLSDDESDDVLDSIPKGNKENQAPPRTKGKEKQKVRDPDSASLSPAPPARSKPAAKSSSSVPKSKAQSTITIDDDDDDNKPMRLASSGRTSKAGQVADSPNTRARKKQQARDQETSNFFSSLPAAIPDTPEKPKQQKASSQKMDKTAAMMEDLLRTLSGREREEAEALEEPPEQGDSAEAMMRNLVKNIDKQGKAEQREKKNKSEAQIRMEEEVLAAKEVMAEIERNDAEKAEAEKLARIGSQPGSEDDFDESISITQNLPRSHRRDLICPYCGGGLPETAEQEFYALKTALLKVSSSPRKSSKNGLRQIDLQKRLEFCTWHEALTTTIPDGIAAGYPDSIKFAEIPDRLEVEWIRKTLEGLAKFPLRSQKFKEYAGLVDSKGGGWWKMAQLKNAAILSARSVGYYGVTGRAIIAEYLKDLLQWGYYPGLLPSADELSRVDPLSPEEYIENIMIPEAAILLIMDDLDKVKRVMARGTDEQRVDLREKAEKVWQDSKMYGLWMFKESKEGTAVLEGIKKQRGELKKRIAAARAKEGQRRKETGKEVVKAKKRSSDGSITVISPKARKIARGNDTIDLSGSSASSASSSGSTASSSSYIGTKPTSQPKSQPKSTAYSTPSSSPLRKTPISVASSSSSGRTSTAVNTQMGGLAIAGKKQAQNVLRPAIINIPEAAGVHTRFGSEEDFPTPVMASQETDYGYDDDWREEDFRMADEVESTQKLRR